MSAALDELARRLRGQTIAVSRALSAADRAALGEDARIVELPIVGGVTVWAARPADAVAVVVTPNHLGIAERLPGGGPWCGIRRAGGVAAHPTLLDDVGHGAPSLRSAQRLARRLTSIRGVTPYHKKIVAPWFTVMASDPGVPARESAGVHIEVLGRAFPDIPGGVRIEVAVDATEAHLGRYAAAVEAAAGRTGG